MPQDTEYMTAVQDEEEGEPEDEIQDDNTQPSAKSGFQKFQKYFKVLWKSILTRLLTPLSYFFDYFAVYQKGMRGHYIWVILSIVFMILPAVIGSLYSLYFYIMEQAKDDGSGRVGLTYDGTMRTYKATRRGTGVEMKARPRQNLLEGVNDELEVFGEEDMDGGEAPEVAETSMTELVEIKKPKKKARFSDDLESDGNSNKKPVARFKEVPFVQEDSRKAQATYAELVVNVNTDPGDEEEHKPPGFCHVLSQFIQHDLCPCIPANKGLVLWHVFLCAREYRFYTVTQKFYDYLNQIPTEEHLINSVKQLEAKGVKKCCIIKPWYNFVKAQVTYKQITLLMSTLENVVMTIIQILYWSSFYRVWDQKRVETTKIPTSTFSPFEILTVIIGVFRIAYNITSSYNHQRELNYHKADMSFFHKLWLMFTHAFFICFRMLVFYSLLCLGTQALVFLLTIISLQFFIYLLAMQEKHDKSTPLLALVVSSVLLLFIYAPASQSSSSKTISRWSYEVIMWVEFIFIVIYSCVHYNTLSEGHGHYWMDQNLDWMWLGVGFGIALGCFVVGKLMHVLARHMWVYKNWDPREKELQRAIRMVNNDLGTDWEFLGKEKEQEEDRNQTIYL